MNWIRGNILGLAAILIALSGTAVATQVVEEGGGGEEGSRADVRMTSAGRAVAQVAAKRKRRPRGLQGPVGPAGPAGQAGATGAPGAPGPQGPGATRLSFQQPETDNQLRPIATVNELTLRAQCSTSSGRANLFVDAQSSSAGMSIGALTEFTDNGGPFQSAPLIGAVPVAPGSQSLLNLGTITNGFVAAWMDGVFYTADRTVSVQVYGIADDAAGNCTLQGTAVPAT